MVLAFSPKPSRVTREIAALSQTYIPVRPGAPVDVPQLSATDGTVFSPVRLRAHWSLIYFGFTSCPLVCPKTLSVLRAVARDPQSGISSGLTQTLFVSVDPERDTPAILGPYLKHFDPRILGITGTRACVNRFSREIGAGSASVGSGIDHSTSLFVLDPRARVAAILLHPNDPARIVADLAAIRHSYLQAAPNEPAL